MPLGQRIVVVCKRGARIVAQHNAQSTSCDVHPGRKSLMVRERHQLGTSPVAHGALRLQLSLIHQLMHERRDRSGRHAHDFGELDLRHRPEFVDRFQQIGARR